MSAKRWAAAAVAVAVLAAGGVAFAVRGGGDDEVGADATTTSTSASTTTTAATTTTTASTTTTSTVPPSTVPDGVLQQGSSGPQVEALQRRLHDLRFDPGPVDGRFGGGTAMAVWAFQKLHGQPADARVTPELVQQIQRAPLSDPLMPDGGPTRTEIDLGRQVMLVWQDGQLRLVTHVSTGTGKRYCENGSCGIATTPGGSYRYTWRYSGWRTSRLGQLYNPVYFNGGIAVHGARSVPAYPASHGCVRIPMHIAEYFPSLVRRGDPVYVLGDARRPAVPLGGAAPPPAEPPPDDPPGPPEGEPSTTTTTAPPTTTTAPPATTAPPTTAPPTTAPTTAPPTTAPPSTAPPPP